MRFVLGFYFDIFPVSLKQLRLAGLLQLNVSCKQLTNQIYPLIVTVSDKLLSQRISNEQELIQSDPTSITLHRNYSISGSYSA